MTFEEFLLKWEPLLQKASSLYHHWAIPKEDVLQELRLVLWDIWKRYGSGHPDVDKIITTAIWRKASYHAKKVTNRNRSSQGEWIFNTSMTLDDLVDEDETKGSTIVGDLDIQAIEEIPGAKDLSSREKQVILLKGLQGLSDKEISKILKVKVTTVQSDWKRAKQKLRRKP